MKYAKLLVAALSVIVFYEVFQVTINMLIFEDTFSIKSSELPIDAREQLMALEKEELVENAISVLQSIADGINADTAKWKMHMENYKKLAILGASSFLLTL